MTSKPKTSRVPYFNFVQLEYLIPYEHISIARQITCGFLQRGEQLIMEKDLDWPWSYVQCIDFEDAFSDCLLFYRTNKAVYDEIMLTVPAYSERYQAHKKIGVCFWDVRNRTDPQKEKSFQKTFLSVNSAYKLDESAEMFSSCSFSYSKEKRILTFETH